MDTRNKNFKTIFMNVLDAIKTNNLHDFKILIKKSIEKMDNKDIADLGFVSLPTTLSNLFLQRTKSGEWNHIVKACVSTALQNNSTQIIEYLLKKRCISISDDLIHEYIKYHDQKLVESILSIEHSFKKGIGAQMSELATIITNFSDPNKCALFIFKNYIKNNNNFYNLGSDGEPKFKKILSASHTCMSPVDRKLFFQYCENNLFPEEVKVKKDGEIRDYLFQIKIINVIKRNMELFYENEVGDTPLRAKNLQLLKTIEPILNVLITNLTKALKKIIDDILKILTSNISLVPFFDKKSMQYQELLNNINQQFKNYPGDDEINVMNRMNILVTKLSTLSPKKKKVKKDPYTAIFNKLEDANILCFDPSSGQKHFTEDFVFYHSCINNRNIYSNLKNEV